MAGGQSGRWGRRVSLLAAVAVLCRGNESPASVNSLEEEMKVMQNIGFYMQIGQAFDMREMQPVSALVSSPDAIEMHTVEMDTPLTSLSYALDDSWESKSKLMSLDVDVEMEYVGGANKINIAGGMEYLKDRKSTSKSISMALSCLVHTKTRTLDAFHPDVRSTLNRKLIDSKLATHVVTGITYGQRTVGTFKSKFEDEEQKEDIEGYLKIGITTAQFEGKLEGNLKLLNEKHKTSTSIESTIYSDSLPSGKLPTEFEETLEFVTTAYMRLGGEIGVPLTYSLTPLKKLDSDAAVLAAALKDGEVLRARDVFQSLMETETEIGELLRLRTRGNAMWEEQAVQMNNEFAEFKLKLQSDLAAALVRMRRGDSTGASVGDVLDTYYASDFEKAKMRLTIGAFEDRLLSFTQIVAPGDSLGVRVAESRSEFMGPVLDMTNDNVYALMVVDAERAQGDLQTTVAFYDYARSTYRAGKGNCVWRLPEADADGSSEERQEAEICEESLSFTAVHFDSLCEAVCPSKYCFKFDPSPENRHITRACNTMLEPNGKAKLPGACMPEDHLAKLWGCWKRPVPDAPDVDDVDDVDETPVPTPSPDGNADSEDVNPNADADAEALAIALFKKHVRAFPEDWCACPKTQIVQFKRTGEDMKVDVNLIAVPRSVFVEKAISEPVNMLKPENQHVLLHVVHPEGQDPASMLRHKVVVLYNLMDEETGEWYEVSRTFETYTNALPIRVTGLRAGWLYRFKVAGVNEFGAGPMSGLSDLVKAGENVATPIAVHGTKRVKGKLPSWAVGGSWEMELEVKLSAQHSDNLTSVLVTETDDRPNLGATAFCQVFAAGVQSVRCRIDLEEIYMHVNTTLHVSVQDVTGAVAARGLLDVVWASEEECAAFEKEERKMLCEAKLVDATTMVQMDPQNQMVELTVETMSGERGPQFPGWKVTAMVAGEDTNVVVAEAVVYGRASKIELWGLTAGERYVFQLAAIGEEDQKTGNFPQGGFQVGQRMPVLKARPRENMTGSTRANALPGWGSYNSGNGFPVTVSLTVPAETKISHVEFKVSPGDEDIWVQCRSLQPVAGTEEVQCVVPIHRMIAVAESEEMPTMPERIPLRALDVSRNVLAKGHVEWNDVSDEACAEFEMRGEGEDPWLLCQAGVDKPDTCVQRSADEKNPCENCEGGPNYIARKCMAKLCTGSNEVWCPLEEKGKGKCMKMPNGGSKEEFEEYCSNDCGGGSYHEGLQLCAQPCNVSGFNNIDDDVFPPGSTRTLSFCSGGARYVKDAEHSEITCPATNMVRQHYDEQKNLTAPWFAKIKEPTCVQCSRESPCGGEYHSTEAEYNSTDGTCRCTCSSRDLDPDENCQECVWPYITTKFSVSASLSAAERSRFPADQKKTVCATKCTDKDYCNGKGTAKYINSRQCKCECDKKNYYGERCQLYCASGKYTSDGKCLKSYVIPWPISTACTKGLERMYWFPSFENHMMKCDGGWVSAWKWSQKRCRMTTSKHKCGVWKTWQNWGMPGNTRETVYKVSLSKCQDLCCEKSWCTHYSYSRRSGWRHRCHLKEGSDFKGHAWSSKSKWTVHSGQVAGDEGHVCRWLSNAKKYPFCTKRVKRCTVP